MDENPGPANKSYRVVGNPTTKRRHKRSIRTYIQIAVAVVIVGLLAAAVLVAILSDWTVPPRR
jgi:hypothetical protein